MKLLTIGVIIANLMSLVGIVYYAVPGYIHVFGMGNLVSAQPTGIAVCVGLFLSAFSVAVYISPKQPALCPHCGQPLKKSADKQLTIVRKQG